MTEKQGGLGTQEQRLARKIFRFARKFKEKKEWYVIGGFLEELEEAWFKRRKLATPTRGGK